MADLSDLRRQLATATQIAADAERTLFVERERLKRLERDLRQLERRFDERDPKQREERERLQASLERARAEGARLDAASRAAVEAVKGIRDRFEPMSDPRRAIGELDARFPILLLPVRLETRFVSPGGQPGPPTELLVRIYPDDCLVDSFEPDLSETEVQNLRRYWSGIFRAGGDEGIERAAWRELCAAQGAGRAVYLVGQYAPLPASDALPVRTRSDDVILVIPIDAAIAGAAEKAAIVAYWTTTWRAGHDTQAFADLRAAVGDARAQQIRKTVIPFNVKERPQAGVDRATVRVDVVFVVMTPVGTAAVKRQAWTRPPRAPVLPDRFVLVSESGGAHVEFLGGPITQPLPIGPDPLAEGADQFSAAGADINVPEALKWMTDFDTAVAAGMGFRVALTPQQAQVGFERLYVIGLRLASDERTSQQELESLIRDQFRSQAGFAIVRQGTPTNNTEDAASGWSRVEEADALFASSRIAAEGVDAFDAAATTAYEKKDGLAIAEALGISADVFQPIPGASGSDQADARAMNAALWPATLGYWMDTQMRPVFDAAAIEQTRRHFIERVSGRGAVPAVRVGRQPYGILPTTAFSRITWLDATRPVPDGAAGAHVRFLRALFTLLRALGDSFWRGFGENAPHVGQATPDPQKLLLDILGLHPSSVDFHVHVLDSADRLWNELKFRYRRRESLESVMRHEMQAGVSLLGTLGYSGTAPEIVEKFESYVEGPMNRPAVDVAPLSENEALPVCTDTGQNYIEWCRDKAEHAFDDLRQQIGFSEGKLPNALLYHMLRHALQLGYHGAAMDLHVANGLIPGEQVAAAYREPAFVHVAGASEAQRSESRYQMLYDKPAQITGDPSRTVADFIPEWLATAGSSSVLADQIEALRVLEPASTARLERAFAEHIDLCTYRWDAWMLSIVREQLAAMRRPQGGAEARREGVYLGAYGWLEHVKPDPPALSPVTLSDELGAVFNTPGQPPLQRDAANGGHVLAPSLNHAVTSAVLRSGYLNNASPANPDLFAVDLSSARVRVALQFVEGIRNGQPLGALLGYQFERRLHDRHAEAETDAFIYQVRKAFPLVAKRISDSVEGDANDTAIENVEARNVCDGLLLLEHVRTNVTKTYPWGKDLDRGTAAQEAIINEEVTALFDIHDAIADVAIAESVHQLTMGNADRAAAAMDAYGKSTFPPEPEVVRTPRTGVSLTHRVALHLPVDAVAGAGATPRAEAEPATDRWLAGVLPPMNELVVRVRYTNTVGGSGEQVDDVSMQALGLQPIDLLYVADPDSEPAMNDLDDRIAHRVITSNTLAPDAKLTIRYTEPVPNRKTWFETAPLIASLKSLIVNARPLRPSDAALETEATSGANAAVDVPSARVTTARNRVDTLRQDAIAMVTTLTPLVDPSAAFAALVNAIDVALSDFHDLQRRAGLCGVTLAGSGEATRGAREWFALVRGKAHKVSVFWTDKLAECDSAIAEATAPATADSLRVPALVRAEQAVSTSYTVPPPDVATFLPIVNAKRAAFIAVKSQVDAVETSAATAIRPLWTAWSATFAPRRLHDIAVIDTSSEESQLRVLLADMHQQLAGLVRELDKRLKTADDAITAAGAAAPEQRAQLLVDAASALFGEGFRVLPRFTLAAAQADEWQNAYDGRASLLTHTGTSHDFPVDDWLYGVARVRAKMHDLEKVIQITGAFDLSEPALDPIQLPFVAGDPWLAAELPPTFDITTAGEHLLYTAIYTPGGFDKTASAHGGLMLDEWTEVIPGTAETAGLAFHYDRPNSEPPHAMLLVTPASASEMWQWSDVERAVPETFALARTRAAEPRDISPTPLARLLPATLMAFTSSGISIASQLHAADVMFAAREV